MPLKGFPSPSVAGQHLWKSNLSNLMRLLESTLLSLYLRQRSMVASCGFLPPGEARLNSDRSDKPEFRLWWKSKLKEMSLTFTAELHERTDRRNRCGTGQEIPKP